jgi:hypothetical protein
MSMRRTNIYADERDLALIKEAARRRGVPEAEIIREGLRLAAMSTRVWDGPLDWPAFDGSGEPVTDDEIHEAVSQGAARP